MAKDGEGSGRKGKGGSSGDGPDDADAQGTANGSAKPGPAGEDLTASVRRFVTIFLFILAIFVIFDQELRNAAGDMVGAVLGPLFAFDHRFPVFTFFPVAIVMVLATSLLRHFMMDWKEMARVQHVTSHLNKELFRATKDDNKYKMKRLNEIKQSPEFTELQSKQMGSTWKVMGPTMIIAVAIFAWMFSFAAAPVAFAVDNAPDGTAVLAFESNLVDVGVVGDPVREGRTGEDGFNVRISQSGRLFAFVHDPGQTGTVAFVRQSDGVSFQGQAHALSAIPAGRTVDLSPGRWSVETVVEGSDLAAGGAPLHYPVIVLDRGAAQAGDPGLSLLKIWPARDAPPREIDVPDGASVSVVVPARGGLDGETVRVRFTELDPGADGQTSSRTVDVGRDAVWSMPRGPTSHVISKEGQVPWARFDLNGVTVLPNWILLYSLFTIPFGYLFQKLFKAWSYRDEVALLQRPDRGGAGGE